MSLRASFKPQLQQHRRLPNFETFEGRTLLATAPVGLDAIARFDQLPLLAPDRLSAGQSSYDRSGDNFDWGKFLRVDGNGDHILLDRVGPGVVNRMWFTRMNNTARLKMWFDNETTPRVNSRLIDLFGGNDSRFPAPLVVGNLGSSGGFTSYLPMPYAKSIRIALSGGDDLYYNVGYETLAPDAAVTTWTGTEYTSAARDVWNNVGRDPKSTAGNTILNGSANLPANGSAALAHISGQGPRSVQTIKLDIPGIAVQPRDPITDDGRAHVGSSEFTLNLGGANSPVTLVRRLDYGIADQHAAVYVNGVYAGDWIDAGSDDADHWRDSSFSLPLSMTEGKASVRVRVQFVSSSNDWNEFRYQAVVNGAPVDTLDVGNVASESAHNYVITDARFLGTRTFTYPPTAVTPMTDTGRAHRGSSRFTIALDARNRGALLVRRFDRAVADQRAGVYVNGAYAGDWIDSGSHITDRWRTSSFYLPDSLVGDRTSVTIEIRYISSGGGGGYSQPSWSEFRYEARSITTDGEPITDRVDVGDPSSESAHSYQFTNLVWVGSQTFTAPHASSDAREILNGTRLRIFWDGQTTPAVDAPLGSYFGMGQFGVADVRSLPLGIGEDGRLYCYFPMPFRTSARIELVNDGGVALNGVGYSIEHTAFAGSFADVGYFRTSFQTHNPTTAGQDINILDASGAGRFLGVTQSIAGEPGSPASRWYLEGDERIYIDGSKTPAIHGTGTEDFYDGAWYFEQGPYSNPLSGNPVHIVEPTGGGLSSDKTSAYRLFLQNAVTFRDGIHVSIEHGATNDALPDVWTLAYYYQSAQPRLIQTDALDVGNRTSSNPASEQAHSYVRAGGTWDGSRQFTYEGDDDTIAITDDGRAFNGSSQFTMKLDPANAGMVLRRRLDAGVADQKANVYVDGALVGLWYRAGNNGSHRWADDDYLIPGSFTAGKSSVRVKIEFVSSSIDWNEFAYTAFSLLPADLISPTATAMLDVERRQVINLNFSETLAGPPVASGVEVRNVTTNAVIPSTNYIIEPTTSGSGWRVRFTSVLADGDYRLTLSRDSVADRSGNSLAADLTYNFFILAGDADHDHDVDFTDLVTLAQNYGQSGRGFSQGNFDYSPDGKVDFNDLVILAQHYGAGPLPSIAAITAAPLKATPPTKLRKPAIDGLA